jgi:glycosidase
VDTLFDFPLYYPIQDVFAKQQPMTRLTETLGEDSQYVDATVLVTLLGLHDKPRFLQDDRSSPAGLKLAFTFLLTTRGTPLVYYGDEIGMTGGGDPYNRKDFPGGWPEDAQNAFESSDRTRSQRELHDYVAKLLMLREELAPLRQGKLTQLSVGIDTYAYARSTGDSFVVVTFNNAGQPRQLDLSIAGLQPHPVTTVTDRLGEIGTVAVINDRMSISLPPKSAALFTPGPEFVESHPPEGASRASPANP